LLGERYLDAHLPGAEAPLPVTCAATRRVLAEVVRGTASATQRHLADGHLADCSACVSASDHLKVVNHRLRTGHLLALAPAITASKPVRLGLLARFFAWLFGSAPVITASVTLVFVAAIAPEARPHVDASASAPPPAVVAPAATVATAPSNPADDPASRPPVAPTASAPARSSTPTAGAASDPEVVPGPGTAPATAPAADAPAESPVDAAGMSLADDLGATVDNATRGAEQTVNDLGLDDGLIRVVQPALDALPPAGADIQVAPVPLGPLGATPSVAVEVDAGDGSAGASVGPAQVGVDIGGPGGVQVSLPSATDLAAALPAPVANLASPLLAPG
jgi:hypothetical protein